MQKAIHVNRNALPAFLQSVHGYAGRRFQIESATSVNVSGNYWDGGSRNYWGAVELATGREAQLQTANPLAGQGRPFETAVPVGVVVWEHTIFCGKDLGVTFYVHPDNLARLLPNATEQAELTEDEHMVLDFTAQLKSSYNGINNYRFYEAHIKTGITKVRWEAAKQALIERRLLDKRGAITVEGRNKRRGKATWNYGK